MLCLFYLIFGFGSAVLIPWGFSEYPHPVIGLGVETFGLWADETIVLKFYFVLLYYASLYGEIFGVFGIEDLFEITYAILRHFRSAP